MTCDAQVWYTKQPNLKACQLLFESIVFQLVTNVTFSDTDRDIVRDNFRAHDWLRDDESYCVLLHTTVALGTVLKSNRQQHLEHMPEKRSTLHNWKSLKSKKSNLLYNSARC